MAVARVLKGDVPSKQDLQANDGNKSALAEPLKKNKPTSVSVQESPASNSVTNKPDSSAKLKTQFEKEVDEDVYDEQELLSKPSKLRLESPLEYPVPAQKSLNLALENPSLPSKEKSSSNLIATPNASYSNPGDESTTEETMEMAARLEAERETAASVGIRRTRPVSARPPPPKQKASAVVVEQPAAHATSIIRDGIKLDDDDDDFVVKVVESVRKPQIATSISNLSAEQHGGLVSKILATKQGKGPENKQEGKLTGISCIIKLSKKLNH